MWIEPDWWAFTLKASWPIETGLELHGAIVIVIAKINSVTKNGNTKTWTLVYSREVYIQRIFPKLSAATNQYYFAVERVACSLSLYALGRLTHAVGTSQQWTPFRN